MPIDLKNIPEETWVRRKDDTVIIGALLKDKLINNLFMLFLVLAITSIPLIMMPSKIMQGEISIYLGSFVILFCVLGLSFMTIRTLMALLGHIEIQLCETHGTVFHGIRNIGRRHTFTYKKTTSITPYEAVLSGDKPTQFGIEIKAEKTIIFGGYLKEKKVKFIINVLQIFLKDGEKIRNLLTPDLIHNLID